MSHARHRHWHGCRHECACSRCAELDLNHPGEGRRLALSLGDMGPLHPAPPIILAAQDACKMTFRTFTHDQLVKSPLNVRTNDEDANAVDALSASIVAEGLLAPLVVHPLDGRAKRWGVSGEVDGSGSLRARSVVLSRLADAASSSGLGRFSRANSRSNMARSADDSSTFD